MNKKKLLLLFIAIFILIILLFIGFKIGQQQGEKGEKFKRTTAEERLAELLDEPIIKEEYTEEKKEKVVNLTEDITKLIDIEKKQIKIITERVGYMKEDKVNLWVALGNVDNIEMKSLYKNKFIRGVRYKKEYLNSNSVNELLQIGKQKDDKEIKVDKVYLILDNSNMYIEYDVYSEKEAVDINSSFKTVSSNGLKVDLMLEYGLGYIGKQDNKGNTYLTEYTILNKSKEKQEYTLKLYTRSTVKSNGLGTLISEINTVLEDREEMKISISDILKTNNYDQTKLIWVMNVKSAKDLYRVEETDIHIYVK